MTRFSLKAVAVGGAVDLIATNLVMLPIAVSVFARPEIAALPAARQTAAFYDVMLASSSMYTAGLILGSLSSVIGGWVAARIAKRDELLHGTLSAFACILLGIYGLFTAPAAVGPWEHAAYFVLTPALGGLGGIVRARQHRHPNYSAESDGNGRVIHPQAPLRSWKRVMYLVNRVLSVCSALFLLLFVMIAAHGHGSGDTNTLTGAIVVSVVAFSMAVLYFAAGRALAAGQKRHWLFHGGAWTLTLLVVLAML